MRRLDLVSAHKVGDGTCDAEDAVVRPRAQAELLQAGSYERGASLVELTPAKDLPEPHLPVAGDAAAREAGPLPRPRDHDAFADLGRRLALALAGQLVVVDPRHLDVEVDAVQERS